MISFLLSFLRIAALILGCFSTLLSFLLLFRFRWSRGGPVLWIAKSYSSALAPFLAVTGIGCATAGIPGSWTATLLGGCSAFIFLIYIARIAAPPGPATGFEKAFGSDWEDHIPKECKASFLKKPAAMRLPPDAAFIFQPNVLFSTVPDTNRPLWCDLWLPSERTTHLGLAFIYLHGGAWYLLDKDVGTRPFFRHLASQGHVIMDISYRLFPETDMIGMVQDAKRAIAWMKTNAAMYGIDQERIIIGGGSAGGHIAMLAAYLANDPKLTPPELEGADLKVHAVVSAYGIPDLEALYYHTGQQRTTQPGPPKKAASGEIPRWAQKMMGKDYHRLGYDKPLKDAGALGSILGCHPAECPEVYTFFSPITHAAKGCPLP